MRYKLNRLGTMWVLAISLAAACSALKEQEMGQFSVPQSPLLRTIERKSGLIAFLGVDGNIYTMNQAGKQLAQVTHDAELGDDFVRYYGHVTWAPDGQHIAYVSYSGSSRQEVQAHLYVSQSNGENAREIFASDRLIPVFLYWAPDSKIISFLAMQTDGNHAILHIAHVEGGEARVIDTGQPLYWAWTPSATQILIHSNGARSVRSDARLAFLSLDEHVIEEGLDQAPALFQAPAISPDGNHLLLAAEIEDGDSALMVVERKGGSTKIITRTQQPISFDWSPNGLNIGYIPSWNGYDSALGPLTIVEVDDAVLEPTLRIDQNVVAFFWSPDSKRVAYFVGDSDADLSDQSPERMLNLSLHVLDIDSGESERLFSFMPSEQFIALIPHIDQHQRTLTIWSPDSRYIAMSAITQSGPAIVVAQADGDFEPRVLQSGTFAVWSWQ